ncbi:Protein CBG17417 [Caenorhabditis briggsae]|uniref:Protein CBG17417 n=1 Tax=Caenorhabditis briggsae TaxID=6238 RepID=A8XR04_CAEBR|nr:Protein CBG17417 [Caenorhabditis briggsae]CAP35079.2 Protein CBG17417 [Caenorhabditis briggsae]
MYREMLKQGNVEIYCDVWPCDRECGKFHKPFLNTTKLRQLKSRTESVDQVAKKEAKEKAKGAFEEIMEAAARKVRDFRAFFLHSDISRIKSGSIQNSNRFDALNVCPATWISDFSQNSEVEFLNFYRKFENMCKTFRIHSLLEIGIIETPTLQKLYC